MTQLTGNLEMQKRLIRKCYSVEMLRERFLSRKTDWMFHGIGLALYPELATEQPHLATWRGFEFLTDSEYLYA